MEKVIEKIIEGSVDVEIKDFYGFGASVQKKKDKTTKVHSRRNKLN